MITLEEAKTHLRVEHDDENALIETLISAAYTHAEHVTGRSIREQTKTVVLDKFPPAARAIQLPWTPVIEITSLDYADPEGNPANIDAATLRLDGRQLYPVLMPQFGTEWPATIDEPEAVIIAARVGYESTPDDIRQALLLLIGHLYEHREAAVIGVSTTELPMGVGMLLGPYRIMKV